jgi:hypothetical protein
LRVTLKIDISVERWWNDTDRGNPKYSEENQFQKQFMHPTFHVNCPGIEPGLLGSLYLTVNKLTFNLLKPTGYVMHQ